MNRTKKSPELQFLKIYGDKTKSNAIDVPSITLPKGGGAIKGIYEKFSVNAINGFAFFLFIYRLRLPEVLYLLFLLSYSILINNTKMKQILTILTFLIATLQIQAQSRITFGANANYHLPMSMQKEGTSPFLFLYAAQSAGLELSFAPFKKSSARFKLAAEYITGTNNKENIAAYAKENKIEYKSYEFTKANPIGISIMASPQFLLFPKAKHLPLIWLDLKAGALYSNQQSLKFFTGQTAPSMEIKSNAVNFVYNPSLVINIIKTKKLFVNLKAGYSNFGGFGFGLNITEQNCQGMVCHKCQGPGCW